MTPTRRTVLTGGLRVGLGALVLPALGGCTDDAAPPGPPPRPDPDVVRADEAAQRERLLLAAYDAALVLAPPLADRLVPLRAQHAEHLAALGLPERPVPTGQPTGSGAGAQPVPTGEPLAPTPPALPTDPAALLAALAELEREAAVAHGDAAVLSERGLAYVLAALAASEASHPVALA